MSRYRNQLPQLTDRLFLTDGGLETTLIFHDGIELPHFAAFDLLKEPAGELALTKYFLSYAHLAEKFGTGLVLESATWRASSDWGHRLGYDEIELGLANWRAIRLLEKIRGEFESHTGPIVLSGNIGPRGDGYAPATMLSIREAQEYHAAQIDTFASTRADMVTAITMTHAAEAIGIVRAAKRAGMPVAISFTVETDGRLPSGQSLRDAIREVDDQSSGYTSYFMINCAHPSHFAEVLEEGADWTQRIRGLRANASRCSHAELNEASTLDSGIPAELGRDYAALVRRFPTLNVLGGCCGTDHRHLAAIARACGRLYPAAKRGAAQQSAA